MEYRPLGSAQPMHRDTVQYVLHLAMSAFNLDLIGRGDVSASLAHFPPLARPAFMNFYCLSAGMDDRTLHCRRHECCPSVVMRLLIRFCLLLTVLSHPDLLPWHAWTDVPFLLTHPSILDLVCGHGAAFLMTSIRGATFKLPLCVHDDFNALRSHRLNESRTREKKSWVSPGWFLGVSWVHPGCLLGVSWVSPW